MPSINDLYPSKYMKAGDIPDNEDSIYTISNLEIETIGNEKKEDKPVLYFIEAEKGMVLNKTNSGILSDLYGDDYTNWAGNRVALYVADVQFQSKMVPALRIRLKKLAPGTKSTAKKEAVGGDLFSPKNDYGFVSPVPPTVVEDGTKDTLATLKSEIAKLQGVATETNVIRSLLQTAGKHCEWRKIEWNRTVKLTTISDAVDLLVTMVAECEKNDEAVALSTPF